MTDDPDEPESGALWRFSLALYASPGVADALIALQDRNRLDVNLILFALWLGVSGRGRLGSEALATAARAVCTIRTDIVEPLRALRQRLRHDPDHDIQHLRAGVKALELAGERLAQTRLAHSAGPSNADIPLESRLAAAHANLALYLGPERQRGVEAVVIRDALAAVARDYAD